MSELTLMRVLRALAFAAILSAGSPELDNARTLYNSTDYQAALKVLLPLRTKDAPTYLLIGQSYYGLDDHKKATEALEKAVAAGPANSDYYSWLGKAYGRRAETSSPLTAPGYAVKARQNFEKAVQLDGANLEALSEMFEYYLNAPGFLGGGMDKAANAAARIAKVNESEGCWARARIAEKRNDGSTAEKEYRRAAELAPKQVGRFLDLARFLAKQGRYQESDETFQAARKVANAPKVMFAEADAYIGAHRNLDTARKLLRQYLASSLTPEDPPRSQAEKLLKQAGS